MVIDGHQRLITLYYFYEGIFHDTGKEFALYECESHYEGAKYKSLGEEDRRRLDDSIIHATIVKQDEPTEDYSSIFHIFERLNTGGTLLRNQEIRNALYEGKFNDLIIKSKSGLKKLIKLSCSLIRDPDDYTSDLLIIGRNITKGNNNYGKLIQGNSYLIDDKTNNFAINLFIDLLMSNREGLFISRMKTEE